MSGSSNSGKTHRYPHTGRRRHAAPRDTSRVRRAGLVGGVVSALALCGAAAPAMADQHHTHHRTKHSAEAAGTTGAWATTTAAQWFTPANARQAADAIQQESVVAARTAARERAAAEAAKAAAAKKAAEAKAAAAARAKAAAARKAAAERAAAQAAASRSARRTTLAATPTASATPTPAATPTPTATATASSSKVDSLISFLKAQLGKPYVYGATGPDSYDCSGLTQAAFASIGVTLPRTSQEQSTAGTPVSVSNLQAGDLIFWGGEGSAYHVGVYIGNGQYLDAANPSSPVGIHQLADYMPDWAVRVL